jgi:hypothetical protein
MWSSEALVAVAAMLVGALVWAVRIEGQVRAHDRELEQLRRDTDSKIRQIHDAIDYIRQRIDRAIEDRSR